MYRIYIVYIFMTVALLLVFVKAIIIQLYEQVDKFPVAKKVEYSTPIGTIFSTKGKILSTSIYKYDVYIDMTRASDEVFNSNINALSDSLFSMFNKYYKKSLIAARKNKKRFFPIKRGLSFSEHVRIKKFPIFNMGRNKGGFISNINMERVRPYGNLAKRTIGFYNENGAKVGLEGGLRKIVNSNKIKILKLETGDDDLDSIQTQQEENLAFSYSDLVSTIDIDMQSIVHNMLLRGMSYFEAEYGCAVLMEVKTGAIRAIANLTSDEGVYKEDYNYAVGRLMEPGSTFKLASFLVALEDNKVDTSNIINTQKGVYKLYTKEIRDTKKGGHGKISAGRVFELSSNIGIVKIINNNYKRSPKLFIDNLYNLGLASKLGIIINGEGSPKIPTLDSKNWSGISLAQISYGYELALTPLQILTFYNGIANNGVIIKPMFWERIIHNNKDIEENKMPKVIKHSMCSKQNLVKLKALLRGVVENGTAKNIRNDFVSISGKTGTTQLNYWKEEENKGYISSFVGYFPSDNPLYSCIIVINKPNTSKGYYANIVAAPIFKNIAKNVYSLIPKGFNNKKSANKNNIKRVYSKYDKYDAISDRLKKDKMPNFKGMAIMDAVAMLENKGINAKVIYYGSGKVKIQFPKPGGRINNKIIILR